MTAEKNVLRIYLDAQEEQNAVNRLKMSRTKIYWISQISGWSIFTLINLLVIASFEELPWQRIIIWIYLLFVGVAFTHILRGVIRKGNWFELPLKRIIPRVLVSSFITGTLIYACVFAVSYFSGTLNEEEYTTATPIVGVINLTGISLFWALIYFSVHFIESYKKKEIETLIWEAAVKDHELKTLKSQLNPHFMFNAMNSIRSLIVEDPESAKSALTKLSNILRYSLQMERTEKVALEDELKAVKDYLDLERIRFEERLQYDFNIDAGTGNVEIPPMMIQTLVENGIKHGVSKRTEGGEIMIDSKIRNSKLKIEIRNSGHLSEDELKRSSGFGVSNTKHRLNLLFGERANFSLLNEEDDKVLAELEIPINRG